jgi:hypothetical protein
MPDEAQLCTKCKKAIPEERLEAMPETRLCRGCSESVGGEFIYHAATENLAKAGSLKKNYGGVGLQKQRKTFDFEKESDDE